MNIPHQRYSDCSNTLGASFGSAVLTVNLAHIIDNYRSIQGACAPACVGAVVKADAYGLGAKRVCDALTRANCADFFVAHLEEALALVPTANSATFYVLNGLWPGTEAIAADAGIIPVLNSLEQAESWRELCRSRQARLPALLQIDTGMSRLGLLAHEIDQLGADFFEAVDIRYLMTHLASADEPAAPANERQIARFDLASAAHPSLRRSFANSAASLTNSHAAGDLVRPGLALYGAASIPEWGNALAPVVELKARVIQVREISAGTAVGYGQTFIAESEMRIATVSAGYADGWPRALGGRGAAYLGSQRLPIVGRVSMDSMMVDVTALPASAIQSGDFVELIGPNQSVDAVARDAGTIAYEILTNLGSRYTRIYLDGPAAACETFQ